jgi:carbon-monoxide dehydrogenase medium subunit
MVIAGGTDLVVALKKKAVQPRRLISLHRLDELDYVEERDGELRIGALSRHADLAAHPLLNQVLPIIPEAVGLIGSWQVRNVGTIGGNICNASPAADSAPPLLSLNARLILASTAGEQEVPIESFFTGPGESILEPDQILKEVVVTLPKHRSAGCYRKLRRRKAVDVSAAGVAFQAEMGPDGRTLARVGISLGGVAPTPIRARAAEAALTDLTIAEARTAIRDCAEMATIAAVPIDDVRATASYRSIIIGAYVRACAERVLRTLEQTGEN